ncbi:ABC transporter ATP-binding protein [Aliidiomarina maris]|uniref:ATP-binding protein Uup n=1 Tax=Aliidiomarina maris TaxID=531312 RepID=A0A327WZA3_9GAMM|nr:ABC transporter ATP-binding protein [Aliidiomarina maris]MCL5051480.1 ABC transporter ATP-binding protein [Bacillota bacterium]RAJ98935.1 ATP-binding cassette subfamily F protein uup [Aliidiomarina maris]RUO25078.1 ABC transporter ATP-binding protein [Aliidiomarina maris]
MSTLLQLKDAQLSFGSDPILDHADFAIEDGERVCIVGRNGAGKSSLMKVIDKEVLLDGGTLNMSGIRVARLPQDPPAQADVSVYDYVAEGLAETGALLKRFHQLSHLLAQGDESVLNEFGTVQQAIDARDGWQLSTAIDQVLTRLKLDPEATLAQLSGGWLRRVALARALVVQPHVLLLDEPTNHLDIDMVEWLEQQLLDFQGAIIFISHDRAFIRHLATRIVDLDRGKLASFPGDYDAYLSQKAHLLEVEATQRAEFDKKLAQEEAWIRQGVKARRTRNEGRVRALEDLRKQRAARRELLGSAKLNISEGSRSGKIVFAGEQVNLSFGDKAIIRNLDLTIQRGDKIALVGPNGCGKSTLIKVILHQLDPDSGKVKYGTNIKVAYFDQHRAALDPEKSIAENVGDGKQDVVHQGRPRHILSYLQDFLFSPRQSQTPVKALSGGERNRALLAKLFLPESNVLILDEPTNDLDVDTLELLEQIVSDYQGTVLLVSHDREFVDNTASSILLFEGDGVVSEIVGGYADVQHYLKHRSAQASAAIKKPTPAGTNSGDQKSEPKGSAQRPKKLSYKLQRELEQLPKDIESMEAELATLQVQVNSAEFFAKPHEHTEPVLTRVAELEEALMLALERWDELEQQQGN